MKINLLGGQYKGTSKSADNQSTLNWYLEPSKSSGADFVLYQMPGAEFWAQGSSAPVRGFHAFNDGNLYAVIGTAFNKFNTSGFIQTIDSSTINTGSGVVKIAHNMNATPEMIIADGLLGYQYDGTTFANMSAVTNYPATATHVVFLDGYFIANDPTASGKFWWSDINDITTWNAASFAAAERSSDALKAIETISNELYLFGENSIEVWYNSGDAVQPFQRHNSVVIDIGIIAPYSLAKYQNQAFWIGNSEDGSYGVYMIAGYQTKKVSTPAIDEEISQFTTVTDAIAFCFNWKGHIFYQLTFPTEDKTFVFDVSMNEWLISSSDMTGGRNHANCYIHYKGKHIIGDYDSSNLLQLKDDVYTYDGANFPRERVTQFTPDNDHQRTFIKALELEFEMGVGNSAVEDPQVSLAWSDDDGNTWSSWHTKSIGKLGEYSNKVIYRRLGWSRKRLWKIRVTDAVKAHLVGAYIDIDVMGRDKAALSSREIT